MGMTHKYVDQFLLLRIQLEQFSVNAPKAQTIMVNSLLFSFLQLGSPRLCVYCIEYYTTCRQIGTSSFREQNEFTYITLHITYYYRAIFSKGSLDASFVAKAYVEYCTIGWLSNGALLVNWTSLSYLCNSPISRKRDNIFQNKTLLVLCSIQ